MQSVDFAKQVLGEPLRCIVRIKPPSNFQKEDVRINNQQILLTDNNRILEEFECPEAYGPEFSMHQIYEQFLQQFTGPFIQGLNVNIFAYGSTGAGKTQTIEGNKKEHGLILNYASSIFSLLENKKFHTNQSQASQLVNYSYGLRARYVEIIDEEVSDLFAPPNKRLNDQLQILDHAWEGPTIANATWVTVNNEIQLQEALNSGQRNRNQTTNEFGKVSNKATSFFTLELLQSSLQKDTNEPLIMLSRLCFFDLAGSEVLIDDPETIRIKQGSTLNKSIISFTQLLKELGQPQTADHAAYDTSALTSIVKELVGSNSLSIGIFCVQHGDPKGTSLTLNIYKYCKNIKNFPIVNDSKVLGLLHKFRLECQAARLSGRGGYGDTGNNKMLELEKKLIEDNLDKMRNADEKQRMAQKLSTMREKYNEIVRQKAELQQELIRSEEEKLEVSKALVELQIENTRLMEIIQNEKYDMNNKLLNAESDLLSLNIREEKALKSIQELQDNLKETKDDKRALEIEFVALKKNYINISTALETEKAKSENIGLELINVVNENKSLHQELNDIYKKSGNTNEENARFMKKIEKLEQENREQREALIYTKAEIERLKTEMLKYEILDQQHRIDLDNKKLEIEKGFLEANREKQNEVYKMNREQDDAVKKMRDEKLLWESQKMELTHKIKSMQRRVNDEEERVKELERQVQELQSENQKMDLQMNEMRSLYRNKLMQFATDGKPDKASRIGYDFNAREDLIRTYTEKEIELNERLEREKKNSKQASLQVRQLKSYARNLKYLCEDWAPVGIPLPDILTKDVTFLDDETYGTLQGDHMAEIERLRMRNKKLENEVRVLQENIMNGVGGGSMDLSKRISNEMEMLKQNRNKQSIDGDFQIDQLRKERNDLQEENRRLVTLLKDNKKWDVYILQRENERLMRQMKEQEVGLNSVGPMSGEAKGVQQKLQLYERSLKQLEKERSELIVRATMAEEQLKALQEHLAKQSQDYQRKLLEIKRGGNIF
ncbi:unnamed protein product [Paramecium octaurelia]|uniref:Kinesin motor domain-containing protein n=1 Tax=Paramecium octaurelia TaxID=43137 RepID=A0A8S1W9A4_PAROT|nr:unnamed protein product [Paramecium octaurelia]